MVPVVAWLSWWPGYIDVTWLTRLSRHASEPASVSICAAWLVYNLAQEYQYFRLRTTVDSIGKIATCNIRIDWDNCPDPPYAKGLPIGTCTGSLQAALGQMMRGVWWGRDEPVLQQRDRH
jgi:hypothetical protein